MFTPAEGRGGLLAAQDCLRLCRQGLSFMSNGHEHATSCHHHLNLLPQGTLSNAGNPMPGLPTGVLLNSTVYALGLQILLKGAAASPAAATA